MLCDLFLEDPSEVIRAVSVYSIEQRQKAYMTKSMTLAVHRVRLETQLASSALRSEILIASHGRVTQQTPTCSGVTFSGSQRSTGGAQGHWGMANIWRNHVDSLAGRLEGAKVVQDQVRGYLAFQSYWGKSTLIS